MSLVVFIYAVFCFYEKITFRESFCMRFGLIFIDDAQNLLNVNFQLLSRF